MNLVILEKMWYATNHRCWNFGVRDHQTRLAAGWYAGLSALYDLLVRTSVILDSVIFRSSLTQRAPKEWL